MTEKYRTGKSILTDYPTEAIIDNETGERWYDGIKPNYISSKEMVGILNQYEKEHEQLKKDVEYWKQVASQYSNELNVFEHCKKHKTKCKNIYWSSD